MHGRLKVRTTEEQKIEKHKEQQKKLATYQQCMQFILSTRKEDSYDDKALTKSAFLLTQNPDIYTLWNYRKEVILMKIKESKTDEENGEESLINYLEDEIRLTQESLRANPKSYGSWHHRYWILLNHPKPNWQNEFNLLNKYFSMDDRNFHCWDFRKLIINKIGLTLTEEIDFSTERLNQNFSNYSSWHYRSTLRKLDEKSVETELNLIQSAIFTDPYDSSAWFYLRWVLSNPCVTAEKQQEFLNALDELQSLEPECKWIILSKCWLTGSLCLNDKNYIDKRVQYYKELIKLDPLRKGQYQDYLKIAEGNSS